MESITVSALLFTVYSLTILAYCAVRRKEVNITRVVFVNACVLYFMLLLTLSFFPVAIAQEKGFLYIPFAKFGDGERLGRSILLTLYAVLLFVPFGFLSGMFCKLRAVGRIVLYPVMAALLASLIIEVSQIYLPFNRICDVDEILFNVIGCFIGALLFARVQEKEGMQKILKKILYY
jgi:glycopeptide antibiotics resistance protein